MREAKEVTWGVMVAATAGDEDAAQAVILADRREVWVAAVEACKAAVLAVKGEGIGDPSGMEETDRVIYMSDASRALDSIAAAGPGGAP